MRMAALPLGNVSELTKPASESRRNVRLKVSLVRFR
jgi:hypothetical protein